MCTMGNKTGRIVEKHYNRYHVQLETGIVTACITGKHFRNAQRRDAFPCTGDWVDVAVENGLFRIEKIHQRTSQLSRKWAGTTTEEHVMAANVDYVIIVLGLDGGRNYSDRLLERLTTVAWNSGATPLVVLNKADLNNDADLFKLQAETIAPRVAIFVTSVADGTGISTLEGYLSAGKVGVFIGPSGVGKSTLTNALLKKDIQRTSAIRQKDKRGRHTTSTSCMFELESGGFIIDSPGLRDVQAWAEEEDLNETFSEIAELAQLCKFSDCKHEGEPGCAVQAKLEEGLITPERYDSYLHLKKELHFLNKQKSEKKAYLTRQDEKRFSKMVNQLVRKRPD